MGTQNAFEQEFRKSLVLYSQNHPNFAWHRLFDTNSFRFVSEQIVGIKQPCDFIALQLEEFVKGINDWEVSGSRGQLYMLECKSSHSNTSFCLDYIKPHQITLMSQWIKAGAKAYFIINNRAHPGKHEAFLVPVEDIDRMVKEGLKSVKWACLRDKYKSLVKIPKRDIDSLFMSNPEAAQKFYGAWDLELLFN
jgi:penicillin-binding protein-related factor A (putative recombinase)